MLKMLTCLLAFGLFALAAPRAAHADVCTDLQSVAQDPAAATAATAQTLLGQLCPNGPAADASAPPHTPAQLTADIASACAAYSDPPQPPAGAPPRAAITAFNTWADTNTEVLACHRGEVTAQQRERLVYDAAVIVWQHQLTAQIAQSQAAFAQQRAAFVEAHARRH